MKSLIWFSLKANYFSSTIKIHGNFGKVKLFFLGHDVQCEIGKIKKVKGKTMEDTQKKSTHKMTHIHISKTTLTFSMEFKKI